MQASRETTSGAERCNLEARHRWGIEEGILVEKRQGYQYEHSFSYNLEAMRGTHFLMQKRNTTLARF